MRTCVQCKFADGRTTKREREREKEEGDIAREETRKVADIRIVARVSAHASMHVHRPRLRRIIITRERERFEFVFARISICEQSNDTRVVGPHDCLCVRACVRSTGTLDRVRSRLIYIARYGERRGKIELVARSSTSNLRF